MPTPLKPAVTKEQYETMSEPEKLVALAEDVLAQIEAGFLKGEHGTYFRGGGLDSNADRNTVQQCLLAPEKACYVCGIGALLVAKARIADAVDGLELTTGAKHAAGVKPSTLADIETTFEDWDKVSWSPLLPRPATNEGVTDRLRTLMQLIVDRRGVLDAEA